MAAFSEYAEYDGLGLAALVAKGEVHPRELVAAAVERIELHNPQLNAVIQPMFDAGRGAAESALHRGPFAGVPFLLKDLTVDYAGVPTRSGSRSRDDYVPRASSELVERQQRAGLIVVGKTNTPEFGLAPVTEPELFGPTRNPWDPSRTAGGSSGGSAAAVAARLVPLAHGSDGGGSIRIPASACGVFGLKPTRGRTPVGPHVGEGWFGLSVEHALTRSVRDSAALLDATHGPDAGAPYSAPSPQRPFLEEVGADPGRLRIAFSRRPLFGTSMDPDCIAAVEEAARLCEELGHHVAEASPAIDRQRGLEAFTLLAAAGAAVDIVHTEELTGRRPRPDDYELITWILLQVARKTGADRLAWAWNEVRMMGRLVAGFFEEYDVLLTSTLAQPPWEHGSLDPTPRQRMLLRALRTFPARPVLRGLFRQMSAEILEPIPNTPLFNMTGQPAASLPLIWNDQGLPVGVQFATRFGDEATLFRLSAQLESARPWAHRVPPIVARV